MVLAAQFNAGGDEHGVMSARAAVRLISCRATLACSALSDVDGGGADTMVDAMVIAQVVRATNPAVRGERTILGTGTTVLNMRTYCQIGSGGIVL